MQIVKQQALVEDDIELIAADTPADQLPDAKCIVPLTLWLQNRAALEADKNIVGISLSAESFSPDELADSLNEIAAELTRFAIIAVEFPIIRDGRGYSLARRLRRKYNYQGELRAYGQVHRDQLYYLGRVGFDSFAIPADQDAEEALKAFAEISVQYQASSDQPQPLYLRRAG